MENWPKCVGRREVTKCYEDVNGNFVYVLVPARLGKMVEMATVRMLCSQAATTTALLNLRAVGAINLNLNLTKLTL